MNQGQEMFYNFIVANCKEENVDTAKEMLKEAFQKQEDKTFDLPYLESFMEKMLQFIKEESKAQVLGAMEHFKGNFNK